jgi:3-hydroxyisobutyrate dehydrogenase
MSGSIDWKSKKVAFLGLGIMGSAMAANLARSGLSVCGWNRTPGKPGAKFAAESGVELVSSIREAVESADLVFVCVNDVPDVEEVVLGESGVAQHARPGTLVVDFGTSGPACAIALATRLKERGLRFMDAPVTGGDVGARNATLTIIAGGTEEDFYECKPYFELLGKKIFLCGPVGSGQGVKLCNQILCAVNLIAVCESLHLADLLGIDRQLVVDVCSTGAGGSWSLANLGPKIAASDFQPAFMIKLIQKDLTLIEQAISGSGSEFKGTKLARQLFERAVELGGPDGGSQGTQAMFKSYLKS